MNRRRVRRAAEDGGARPWCSPLGGEGEGVVPRILARVGACADELRLMRVERADMLARMGSAGMGWGSVVGNVSSVRVPSSMERM